MSFMDVYAALGDPTRRVILEMLARKGDLSATEIYGQFKVSHPAISQHLKVLRDANLVQVTRKAQQRIYALNREPLEQMEGWIERLTQLYDERYEALDRVLAAEKEKLHLRSQNKGDQEL